MVDADACPRQALQTVARLAKEFNTQYITYASFNHQLRGDNHIIVDASPQAVDIRLANDTKAGDIVVTQDIGLGALVLGRGARALTPHGKIFDKERITFDLEVRNEKARFRRGGGRTKGPAARTAEDEEKFERSLRSLLEKGDEQTI